MKSERKFSTNPSRFARQDRFEFLEQALRSKARDWIEEMMNEELDAALGIERYGRGEKRKGYRKGARSRTFTARTGAHKIKMPRGEFFEAGEDGGKAWHSRILPPWQRRSEAVEQAVMMCYLSGTNTRKVRKALAPLLEDASLGRSTVSRIAQRLTGEFNTWRGRDLSGEEIVMVFLDAFNLKIRLGGRVESIPVLSAIGVCADGRRLFLILDVRTSESEAAWLAITEDLSRRALQAPVLAVIDGCKGLRRAVRRTWPRIEVQRCTKHKLENLETHAPKRLHGEIKADWHAIIYAGGESEARLAMKRFEGKWSKRCPGVVKSLREAGDELLTFYKYPESMWKMLRTTNGIERLNEEFRRRVKTQGSFPNVDAGLKVCYGLLAGGFAVLRRIDGWRELPRAVQTARLRQGTLKTVDNIA